MNADAPLFTGNSLDIVRADDLSSYESKTKKRKTSTCSGICEHNYNSFLFIFSFIFVLSCLIDIFLTLYKNKENGNYKNLSFFLRIINDALCIFPWFIYLKHIDYKKSKKNIIIGIFVAAPQLIINILTVVFISLEVKNDGNNNLDIFISNIINLVIYVLFTIIMILWLGKA